jgi:hypothetical protein
VGGTARNLPLLKNKFDMKAVQVYYQCKGTPAIVHADVEEIPCNEKSIFTSREFRCRHCGERWVEAINSPIILDQGVEDHLDDYFSNIMYCQQKK